jgi:acyl-coenzyme A thioesterase PaaI-like protein
MTMHFMRRPQGHGLTAEARILRRGKRSIVCAVDVFVEGQGESVCHVVGSYAVPSA